VAFPVIASSAFEEGIGIGTGGDAFTLPSGIVADNLLLAICTKRNVLSLSTSSAWSELDDEAGAGNTATLGLYARIATADASDAFELSGGGSGNDDYAVVFLNIEDHGVTDVTTDIPFAVLAENNVTIPNPPSVDAGVSADYLCVVACSFPPSGAGQDITDDPSGYTQVHYRESADNSGGVMLWVSQRDATTQVEDPTTFTTTTSRPALTLTLMVPPVAEAPDDWDEDPVDVVGIIDSVTIGLVTGGTDLDQVHTDPVGILDDTVELVLDAVLDGVADPVGITDSVTVALGFIPDPLTSYSVPAETRIYVVPAETRESER
jgi:hypothetical protein